MAEVLITLGIIGVVAALTLPSVITNYQKKQTVVQLKKTYTELAQAIDYSKNEYGEIENWDFSLLGMDFFNKYLCSFIKISSSTVGNNNIKYYETSGNVANSSMLSLFYDANVVTLNSGAQLFLSNRLIVPQQRRGFWVDINGFKKPNKFGRDLFYFVITEKGVLPLYWDDYATDLTLKTRTQLIQGPSVNRYNCSKHARGVWCAALIMQDGWNISDDYPW